MTVYIYIVIGVLSATQSSFSLNLKCTELVSLCPTAQWMERGKQFNCPGNKKYVCLMAPGNQLREGCIFNYTVQAGQTGCPYTKQCDIKTNQPMLVAPNNFLPCPPYLDGCPPINHSGYSILEIYKYARCQGRNTSDKSSISPDDGTGTPTTIAPDKILQYENWTLTTLSIAFGLLFIFFVIYLVFRKIYEVTDLDIAQKHFNRKSKSILNQEHLAETGAKSLEQQHLLHKQDNSSPDTTIETEVPFFKKSIQKTASKKKDVQQHPHSSSCDDSEISQTPSQSLMRQQTSQLSHKRHLEAPFIVSNQDAELYQAASNGDIETVKELIDAKADINAKNFFEDTPLHAAASNGHIHIVKILIDAKANVNAKELYQNTPLHKAASNGHSDTVKILIDANADINAKNSYQNTPLHKAASNGHSDTVKILIDANADINAKDSYQNTPLHKAASNGHSDTVKILIDANADINAKDLNEDTRPYKAASNCQSDTVNILIDDKVNVNAKSWVTPLHMAASNGHSDTAKMLIDCKAYVNAKDSIHGTPLHWAALNGHSNIVRMLIEAKADVNAKGWDTSLHKAALKGHTDIVKILIDANADVNAKSWNKNTPLHEAAEYGHVEIIRSLLSSAANFSIRNSKGKTAEELGNPKTKQAFRDVFEKVPNEIKRLGVDTIRQFLKSLNEDAVPFNVVNCKFIGHVGVGKTILVNSLLGLPRQKTKMTSGIDLHIGKIFANIHTGEWHMQDEQIEKIIGLKDFTQINVWDFAGNIMYYTLHQDHLFPRHLYILVFNASLWMDGMVDDHSVDPSDEGKKSVKDYIEFWVTTTTTYVQSDVRGFPRIVLVGTHIDKLPDTLEISHIIEEIKIKFQPLVDTGQLIVHEDLFINACDMNAETTRKLRDIILLCGKSYPEYGQMIPRSWHDLHQKLILRKSEKVIALDQLEQINSQMEKPLNEKELIYCIQYFHSLGYLLFFPDEEHKDHIVLDPRWITNAMLSFITCWKSSSEKRLVQKWLNMQNTGRIERKYFDEVSMGNIAETRVRRNLQRFMKKLDLVSEPKVYNAEGFEECQDYFYMPCIMNRDISLDALNVIEIQEAVQLSFSFNTAIPSAVYNRLIASSLSLWPVFDSQIYHGLIILQSGPLHLIAFRREYNQINISVVHLDDQRHINVCLCRTIVQFVEQRLTWILSTNNTVETKSLFHITYNSAAAENLKASLIKEEDGHCEDRCKSDVAQDTSYVVDDLLLMRVALLLKVDDMYPLAAKIYNHKTFADDLQSDYKELNKSDIVWLILMEWKRQVENQERTPSLIKLRRVLDEAGMNSHILCKVIRLRDEHHFGLDPEYLQTDVHDELLHAVADRISSEYIHVGLELGLKADDILKLLKKFNGRTVELIRAMLQKWYDNNRGKCHVKVVNLATALLNAKCDISVLHEFEKQKFQDRNI